MPRIPGQPGQVIPLPIPPPDEVYLAMAAADMDLHDRLFEDKPKPGKIDADK